MAAQILATGFASGIRLRARIQATQRAIAIVGALAIVLFGAVQTTLILTGYVQPALT